MSTWNQLENVVARFGMKNGKVETIFISAKYGFRQRSHMEQF